MHFKNLAFFISVLSGYAGMQITAFHAQNVRHPQKTFPLSIASTVLIILLVTVLGSLAIAVVVPKAQLDLIDAMFDGFSLFLNKFHIGWTLPILVGLIAISSISELSAWFLAPARGLVVAAKKGLFPKPLAYENKRDMPQNILLLQAIIVTVLALTFIFMHDFSTAFWTLLVITSQLTMVAYILMFGSLIRLRYSQATRDRPFKIPGGKPAVWIIAGISIICSGIGLILGFAPPASLHIIHVFRYEAILIIGDIVYILVPIFIYGLRA